MTNTVTTTVSATGAGVIMEASMGETIVAGLSLYAITELLKWAKPKVIAYIKSLKK